MMDHSLKFYGTGAAEAIPCPFCSCRVCQNARETGGREVRRRSMFRVSEEMCIDLGPDTVDQAIRLGDLTKLRHVLVTHTHLDHLTYGVMEVRQMAYAREEGPLNYYLADKAFEVVKSFSTDSLIREKTEKLLRLGIMQFHRLEYGETVEIAGCEVTPLRGNHRGQVGENSANYLLRLPDGKMLYYGLDTGWYLPETLQALRGKELHYLISECTFGLTPGRGEQPGGHLDAFACERLLHLLAEQGTLTGESRVYLTHINHYTSTGAELEAWLESRSFPCPVILAYDGLQIGAGE